MFVLPTNKISDAMESSMVDVKYGDEPQCRVKSELHLMLGGRTPQVNGQDQIVQSGNYCYSSERVAYR